MDKIEKLRKIYRIIKIISIPSLLEAIGIFLLVVMLLGALYGEKEKQTSDIGDSFYHYSEQVRQYKDIVTNIAKEYDMEKYVDFVLAIMDVSSGGEGTDIMASSSFESNTDYKNSTITNPEYSVRCAFEELKELITIIDIHSVEDREKLLIMYQAYHVGRDYIEYCGGAYSEDNAAMYIKEKGLTDKQANFATQVDFIVNTSYKDFGDFIYPLNGYTDISSYFGNRVYPLPPYNIDFHTGLDFPAPKGTPIRASAAGTIIKTGVIQSAYGIQIQIKHSNTYTTMYAHLDSIDSSIEVGKDVKQGDVIGYVGTTGNSTGYHLHFTIYKDGECVDPLDYLSKKL